MNGTYYPNPTFPSAISDNTENNNKEIEVSNNRKIYLDDLLSSNIGRKIKVYTSINDYSFEGILENTVSEYLVISELETGKWYIIPQKFINYIESYEKINI